MARSAIVAFALLLPLPLWVTGHAVQPEDWCSDPSSRPPGMSMFETDVGEFGVYQCFDGAWEPDPTAKLAVRPLAGGYLEWWAYEIQNGSNGNAFVHPGITDHSMLAELRFDYEGEPPPTIVAFQEALPASWDSSYEIFECYSYHVTTITGPALPSEAPEDHPHCVRNSTGWGVGRFEIFQCFSGDWVHVASLNIQERIAGKSYFIWWAFRVDSASHGFVRPSKDDRESTLCYRKVAAPEKTRADFEATLPWRADIYEETMTRYAVSP